MTLQTHTYKANEQGPKILVLGRIHGNEPGGEKAIRRFLDDLEKETQTINKGEVTFIPCCNPKAAQENKRYIDVNLNRIIDHDLAAQYARTYEGQLASDILTHLDKADIIIDIHTYSDDIPPCVVCTGDDAVSQLMASACPIQNIVCDSPYLTAEDTSATFHYTKKTGKAGILIEAGQNEDPQTALTAYNSLVSILSKLQVTSFDVGEDVQGFKNHTYIQITDALYNKAGYELMFDLEKTKEITIGMALYKDKAGKIFYAQTSGHLYMKNPKALANEEYAFMAQFYQRHPSTVQKKINYQEV